MGSKITANGDSHEMNRRMILVRESYDKPDFVLKSKDMTLLTNVRIVKAMVFPVGTHSCESWTAKKAKH